MKTTATYFDGLGFPAIKEFSSLNNAHAWAHDAGVFDKTSFETAKMKTSSEVMELVRTRGRIIAREFC